MATVTGNLKDIVGASMDSREAVILFTLNSPNVVVGSGGLRPDAPKEVTPGSNGDFSVNLEPTVNMFNDAWYTISIMWLQGADGPQGKAAALQGFLDIRLRVPSGGGTLDQLLTREPAGGRPGPNGRVVWVSQTAPPRPHKFMLWLEQEPGPTPDPFDPKNTSNLKEWI